MDRRFRPWQNIRDRSISVDRCVDASMSGRRWRKAQAFGGRQGALHAGYPIPVFEHGGVSRDVLSSSRHPNALTKRCGRCSTA